MIDELFDIKNGKWMWLWIYKSKFNDLRIPWNEVQGSHEEHIQTILDDTEDASGVHDQANDEFSKK